MIIAIDETGDFATESSNLNFFIAVLIDQNLNHLDVKRSQFYIWESNISDSGKENGEVKGRLLLESQLNDFYNQVLEPDPLVDYSIVSIIPNKNLSERINAHKEYLIQQVEIIVKKMQQARAISWLKVYKPMIPWLKNRLKKDTTLIKMDCLKSLLFLSFERAFVLGQLTYLRDKDTNNLNKITVKIDKDFIKSAQIRKIWDELVRHASLQHFGENPLGIIDFADVPIPDFYQIVGNYLNVKNVFVDSTDFEESKDSWEIRMADLVGTILHRYHNKEQCKVIGKKIMQKIGGKRENYVHLYY